MMAMQALRVEVYPPRSPLRVRRYGRSETPDGGNISLNGYVVVHSNDIDYEIAYMVALYHHKVHGRPMPYALDASGSDSE